MASFPDAEIEKLFTASKGSANNTAFSKVPNNSYTKPVIKL